MARQKEFSFKKVDLGNYDFKDTNEFIKSMLLHFEIQNSQEFSDLVFEKTGGNPFYVAKFLDRLIETETLRQSDQGLWVWDKEQAGKEPSTSILMRNAVNDLILNNSFNFQAVKYASLIGKSFPLEDVEKLLETEDLSPTMQALIDKKLLEKTPQGQIYTFIHDKVIDSIHEMIPDDERRMIHHQLGTFLL